MEDKIKELLELLKKIDSYRNQTAYKINIFRYGIDWVVAYDDFEWTGENLDEVLSEAIDSVEEMIQEREEEEREYYKQRESDYWSVQGAKLGKVNCF